MKYRSLISLMSPLQLLVCLFFCILSQQVMAQDDHKAAANNTVKEFNSLFAKELDHINTLSPNPDKTFYFIDKSLANGFRFLKNYNYCIKNSGIDKMARLLIEYSSFFDNEQEKRDHLRKLINQGTLEYRPDPNQANTYSYLGLNTRNSLMILSLVEEYLHKTKLVNVVERSFVRDELRKVIELYTRRTYCFYDYPSSKKSPIKFLNVRTGNDMFNIGRNYDMGYTGSLLVELGTDLLRFKKTPYTSQYQTLSFGLEVHTPYFRDTTIFKSDSSYNTNDYPHGSFLYAGRSVYKLHKSGLFRDRFTVKLGKIGGNAGRVFQETLHFDVSQSPPTKGWSAQIANGGRIGAEVEYEAESTLIGQQIGNLFSLYLNTKTGGNFGSYQTNFYSGLNISNQPFKYTNQQQVCNKGRFYSWYNNFYISAGITFRRNFHNSMLEGYGWNKTLDNDTKSTLPGNAKTSVYKLSSDKIIRRIWEYYGNISYTFKSMTLLYNFYSRSPEAKFDKNNLPRKNGNGEPIDLNRWFKWGEVGVVIHSFSR